MRWKPAHAHSNFTLTNQETHMSESINSTVTPTSDRYQMLHALDQDNLALRARNDVRLAAAKLALGDRYVLHPSHAPVKSAYTPVLKLNK
jgi:hypothetical protein